MSIILMMWGKLLVCEVYALTLPQYPSFGRLVPDHLPKVMNSTR